MDWFGAVLVIGGLAVGYAFGFLTGRKQGHLDLLQEEERLFEAEQEAKKKLDAINAEPLTRIDAFG